MALTVNADCAMLEVTASKQEGRGYAIAFAGHGSIYRRCIGTFVPPP